MLQRATTELVEALEKRVMLSVTALSYLGPVDSPGSQWTYLDTVASGQSGTVVRTVIGPASFANITTVETDQTTPGGQGQTFTDKRFGSFDGAGNYNFYGMSSVIAGNTNTDVYSPALQTPAQATQGVSFSETATENSTVTDGTGAVVGTSQRMHTEQNTVVSETPSSVTVPLGTFQAIDVRNVTTDTVINTDGTTGAVTTTSVDSYYVAGMGMIKVTSSNGTTAVLTAFNSTQDHLAFTQQPPDSTAAGKSLAPSITVTAEDSMNNSDADATGSVTLALSSFAGAGTGTLNGTLTEPLVDGVATFSDLSIDAGGNYVLAATNSSMPPIAPATSNQFKISEGKLIFKVQPANGSAQTPLKPVVTVELVDKQNHLITDSNSIVTLNIAGTNSANPISGNIAVLANGVATFPVLTFDKPDTYMLGTSDDAGDTTANSKSFKITGLHLVFTAQPKNSDVNEPLTFKVTLKDARNKVVTNANGQVLVSLDESASPAAIAHGRRKSAISGGTVQLQPPDLEGTTAVQLQNGVADFTPALDDNVNDAGTYMLAAIEDVPDSNGVLSSSVATMGGMSKPFKIEPLHIVFTEPPPKELNVGDPITFSVEIEDSGRHLVTDATTDLLGIEELYYPTGADQPENKWSFETFTNGVASFDKSTNFTIFPEGSYRFVAGAFPFNGGLPDSTAPTDANYIGALSQIIKINGLHLAFLNRPNIPSPVLAGQPITFRMVLEDSNAHTITTGYGSDDLVGIENLIFVTGATQPTSEVTYVPLVNGIATFGVVNGLPTIDTPGKYEYEMAAYQNFSGRPGLVDPFVKGVESTAFLVTLT